MKIKLLVILMAALCGKLYAFETAGKKMVTVVIHNPAELRLSIKAEHTSDVFFDSFETKKKYDTLYFESDHAFRLVITNWSADKEFISRTFIINCGEQIVLEWLPEGIKAASVDKIRSNELNFFVEMQKATGNFEGTMIYIPHKRKNADSLLVAVTELYKQRFEFLDSYKVTHPVSDAYEVLLRKVLTYRSYYDFLDHCIVDRIPSEDLVSNQAVNNFLEPLFNIRDRNSIEDENNIYFLEALYFSLLFKQPLSEYYRSYYQSTKSQAEGNIRDYLLFSVIKSAYSARDLGELVDDYLSTADSDVLKKYVADKYGSYGGTPVEIKKPDYDHSKESLLYNLKTRALISWDELMKSDGVKYIDFWATWCGGCRVSLPDARKLAEEYAPKGVRVIYVSKDENVKAWTKISKKEQLPDEDSYLLLDSYDTLITKRYAIQGIPRYMITDKAGNIINEAAPKPDGRDIKEKLEKAFE